MRLNPKSRDGGSSVAAASNIESRNKKTVLPGVIFNGNRAPGLRVKFMLYYEVIECNGYRCIVYPYD